MKLPAGLLPNAAGIDAQSASAFASLPSFVSTGSDFSRLAAWKVDYSWRAKEDLNKLLDFFWRAFRRPIPIGALCPS
jgi:hypothetical protein